MHPNVSCVFVVFSQVLWQAALGMSPPQSDVFLIAPHNQALQNQPLLLEFTFQLLF